MNRVLGDVGHPTEEGQNLFTSAVNKFIRDTPIHVVPMSRKKWFDTFPKNQREEMEESWEKYKQGDFSWSDFKKTSCFIKIELQPCFMNTKLKEFCPRCICACPPMIKPVIGPWCRSALDSLVEYYSYLDPVFVEVKSTAEQVGMWVSYWWPKFDTHGKADHHRFDKHEGEFIIAEECRIYEAFGLKGDRLRVMATQIAPVSGVGRRGCHFKRTGFRRTGVPNTTLGNTIVNLLCYLSYFNSVDALPGRDYVVMVHGDDSIVFMRSGLELKLQETINSIGFDIDFTLCDSISKIRYCSSMFYPIYPHMEKDFLVPATVCPGPTLKALIKMNYTFKNIPQRAYNQHQRGVALGLQKAVQHIPLLNDAVMRTLSITQGAHGSYLSRAFNETQRKIRKSTGHLEHQNAVDFLSEAYGVPSDILRRCRCQLKAMRAIGLYSSPELHLMTRAVTLVEYE